MNRLVFSLNHVLVLTRLFTGQSLQLGLIQLFRLPVLPYLHPKPRKMEETVIMGANVEWAWDLRHLERVDDTESLLGNEDRIWPDTYWGDDLKID